MSIFDYNRRFIYLQTTMGSGYNIPLWNLTALQEADKISVFDN